MAEDKQARDIQVALWHVLLALFRQLHGRGLLDQTDIREIAEFADDAVSRQHDGGMLGAEVIATFRQLADFLGESPRRTRD